MSFAHLNQPQRYQIEKQLGEGKSPAVIARRLGIDRSTVYRERARGLVKGHYCASTSHQRALKRRAISAANHRMHSPPLWQAVSRQLRQEWSPEQISGRWKLTESVNGFSVSAQAIYNWLARSDSPLRCRLRHHQPPPLWRQGSSNLSRGRPSIRKRPKDVLERKQTGHWEGDTLLGRSRKNCLVTLVERKSLYTCISQPLPKLSDCVARYIRRKLTTLSARSLTLDNGSEFARYLDMGLPVFFADPGRPRQRSRNENTNGLIRQYVPKGVNIKRFSSTKIRRIEQRLNHRPRKTLGYKTPHEVLFDQPPTPVAIRT